MAEVRRHISVVDGDTRWGLGLERFIFRRVAPEASKWYQDQNRFLPAGITEDFLRSAPQKAVALIRDVAHATLLEGLKIEKNNQCINLIDRLGQIELGKVQKTYKEKTDNGRTTNYVIPIKSGSGKIEIVVNPAWGVQWRLSPDHPLAKEEPKLAKAQNEDTYDDRYAASPNPSYVSHLDPKVLADVSKHQGIDAQQIATQLSQFLTRFLSYGNIEVSTIAASLYNDPIDNLTYALQITAAGRMTVELHLGNQLGSKMVEIKNIYPLKGRGTKEYNAMVDEARALSEQMQKYYNYI